MTPRTIAKIHYARAVLDHRHTQPSVELSDFAIGQQSDRWRTTAPTNRLYNKTQSGTTVFLGVVYKY